MCGQRRVEQYLVYGNMVFQSSGASRVSDERDAFLNVFQGMEEKLASRSCQHYKQLKYIVCTHCTQGICLKVQFPDVEKVEWLNKMLQQAWPFIGMFMEKLLRGNIQQSIRLLSPTLKSFTFTKVNFGHIPVKITGLKACTHELDRGAVILDLDISYESDMDIDACIKAAITFGIKEFQLYGSLRVILEPLIGQAPLVGGVTFFFMSRPTLKVHWKGMCANVLDSPICSYLSEEAITDILASFLVLPNRMCIPLIAQVKVDQMKFPLPYGVVRVHLLEARDLLAMDTYMMGLVQGKSDPYTVLRVGNKKIRSHTILSNLSPTWNEVHEFVVHEAPGQHLEIEVFDEDTGKDDFLGRYDLDLEEVKKDKEIDQWFPLAGVHQGEIHMKLQWFSLQTDHSLLTKYMLTDQDGLVGMLCLCRVGLQMVKLVLYWSSTWTVLQTYLETTEKLFTLKTPGMKPGDYLHMLYVGSGASGREPNGIDCPLLVNVKKSVVSMVSHVSSEEDSIIVLTIGTALPDTFVELSIDEDVQNSQVMYASKDPVWEQGFTFLLNSVKNKQLSVQVKEFNKESLLGAFSLPLNHLLDVSNMCLDQHFMLEHSGTNSQVKMKVTLRILNMEKPKPECVPSYPSQTPQTYQDTSTSSNLSSPTSPASSTITAQVPPPAAHSTNGFNGEYEPYRRGTFLVSEGQRTAPHMRRFYSHILLPDNSVAHSMFDLSEGAPFPESMINHRSEIQLSLSHMGNKLVVVINSGRNLFPCNENGADSYVRLYLLPDQSWRHRKKTQVKRKTINPSFNETFEFNVSLEEAVTRKLDLAVKNSRMLHTGERKEIGMALIDLFQVDLVNGSTQWYELTLPGLKESH